MVIIVRRVLSASVTVDEQIKSSINEGLLLYVGIGVDDREKECEYFAKKTVNLRIFDREQGEVSIKDIGAQILSVSQFTLLGDAKKGNRPTYSKAMKSQDAEKLFNYFNECLHKESNLNIQTGVFGADMKIEAVDDGPFTILLS